MKTKSFLNYNPKLFNQQIVPNSPFVPFCWHSIANDWLNQALSPVFVIKRSGHTADQMRCCWKDCIFYSPILSNLFNHSKQHITKQPFVCEWDKCNRVCNKRARLHAHLLTHIPYRAHTCTSCGRGFKRQQELRRHFMSLHVSGRKHSHSTDGTLSDSQSQSRLEICNLIN